MREEGTVVGMEGRLARVRMKPGPECGRCCACSALGGGDRELEIESGLPLRVGSRVVVEIAQGSPWLSALLLFVLPLAGLLSVMIVGAQTGMNQSSALALSFGVLAALFALAAAIDRKLVRPRQKPPAIVEVLEPER
ncbi:MAG: SoxR reducing system RseC family protein [Planctomycetes bacterium]|nr:SoxR reducing system RseC family protein [Planctomycetota bacterium]